MANWTVKHQKYGLAKPNKKDNLTNNGVLGMGWPSNAKYTDKPVLHRMMNEGIIENGVFAFYLNRLVTICNFWASSYLCGDGYMGWRYSTLFVVHCHGGGS